VVAVVVPGHSCPVGADVLGAELAAGVGGDKEHAARRVLTSAQAVERGPDQQVDEALGDGGQREFVEPVGGWMANGQGPPPGWGLHQLACAGHVRGGVIDLIDDGGAGRDPGDVRVEYLANRLTQLNGEGKRRGGRLVG